MEAMRIYDLPYAQEHLAELFQEARTGEDVIIVRADGRRCQLLPLGDVKEKAPAEEESTIFGLGTGVAPVPA
jgi:antitoxin (DNA-binding transcriptional repressor) of toxin-antitoxin stability system